MFRKTAKKIAIALNVFMVLQLASMGLGVQSASARIEEPTVPTVTKLELVEADTAWGGNYGEITEGKIFNISVLNEDELSVLASTNPSNLNDGSVRFELNGYARNENAYPYYLNGNHYSFVYEVDDLVVGDYALTATPYSGQNGTGTPGVAKTVHFSIIDNPVVTGVSLSDKVIKDSDANDDLDIYVNFSEDMEENSAYAPKLYVGDTLLADSEYGSSLVCQPHGYQIYKSRWLDDNSYKFNCEMKDANVELPATGLSIKGAKGDHYPNAWMVPYTTTATITVDTKNPVLTIETTVTNQTKPVIYGTVDDVNVKWVKVKVNGVEYLATIDPMTGTWMVNVNEELTEGTYPVSANAKDIHWNRSEEVTGTLAVDLTAPLAVTGLTANFEDGKIVLNWTNPTEEYARLQVVRTSGSDTVAIDLPDKTVNTYVDSTVVAGNTYSYQVLVFDLANNSASSNEASVSVPVPVTEEPVAATPPANQIASAAISDTAAAISTEKTPESKEVKAEETKDEDNKDEGLPFWGLLLLIVLAGVGAYLFYAQKPAPVVVPPLVSKKKPVKNTRPKAKK
jgi:hypothetical protein